MKKVIWIFLFGSFLFFNMSFVNAENLTCQYDMGENESPIVINVSEDQRVTAKQVWENYAMEVKTSNLLYESFLANNKTTLKCPETIYRALSVFPTYYEVCSNKSYCEQIDLSYVTGSLDLDNSSKEITLSEETQYMSCEYQSNGLLPGTNNARILYIVKNGVASFSIQYRDNGSYQYTLTPSDDFEIADSCEEQGSLWINNTAQSSKTVSSFKDGKHTGELTLVSEENREILDQDQTNNVNNGGDQHGFEPGDICEGDNCDIRLSGVCNDAKVARTLKFIGLLFYIAKIMIPAIIIIMGFVNLFQIILSGKEDQAKKYATVIVKRVFIGVAIFLLPGMIQFVYQTATNIIGDNSSNKFDNCIGCIFDPNDSNSCKIDASK